MNALSSMPFTITAQLSRVNNRKETYQTVNNAVNFALMNIFEIRRKRLRQLIDMKFDRVVLRCAEELDMKPPQLHRWLSETAKSRQNMHENSAREIESKLGLPRGWMDLDQAIETQEPDVVTYLSRKSEHEAIPLDIDALETTLKAVRLYQAQHNTPRLSRRQDAEVIANVYTYILSRKNPTDKEITNKVTAMIKDIVNAHEH